MPNVAQSFVVQLQPLESLVISKKIGCYNGLQHPTTRDLLVIQVCSLEIYLRILNVLNL